MLPDNQNVLFQRESHQMHPRLDTLSDRVALLLAGGDGTRLSELTREVAGSPIPKQYCRLLRGSSLLEATISRTCLFATHERISVVINENHLYLAKDQVKTLPESNIIVQPQNRDTGPGMIYALLHLEHLHPNATVAVFPTDHYVDKDWAFIAHVLNAVNTVSQMPDKIAVLGIVPDRPETGYGYILPAKPDLDTAETIIDHGGLWNTFVMVFKLSRMLELLQECVLTEFETMSELRASPDRATEIYRTLAPWNFSTQLLARIPQHLIVLRVGNVRWSDWGTRESVERTYKALKLVPSWQNPSPVDNAVNI